MFILNKFWCHQFGSCLFSVFVWFPNFPINRRLQFTNGNTFAHTSYKFWRFSFTKEMLKMIKWNGREVKGDNGVEIDRVGMLLVSLSKRKKRRHIWRRRRRLTWRPGCPGCPVLVSKKITNWQVKKWPIEDQCNTVELAFEFSWYMLHNLMTFCTRPSDWYININGEKGPKGWNFKAG